MVVDVELDRDDGTWSYEFELDGGMEVKIDASTGEYLKTEVNPGGIEDDQTTPVSDIGSDMDRESND